MAQTIRLLRPLIAGFVFGTSLQLHCLPVALAAIAGIQSDKASDAAPLIPKNTAARNISGRIVEATGSVSVIRGDKNTTSPLAIHSGDTLMKGDLLQTGPDGTAKVVLGNHDAALLIKPNSQLEIDLTPDQEWRTNFTKGMALFHIKHRPSHRPSYFKVKTRGSVLGVRGTTFFLKDDGTSPNLFLCTCEGVVALDTRVLIVTKHHDSPKTIQVGDQPLTSRMTAALMGTDHSDPESKELEELLKG